jgi:hypothetical protein
MRLTICCFLLLVAAMPARADFIYEFAIGGNASVANSTINLQLGDTVQLQVWIRETSTSFLLDQGLNSAGVRLNVANSGGVMGIDVTRTGTAPNLDYTNIVKGPQFTSASPANSETFQNISNVTTDPGGSGGVTTTLNPVLRQGLLLPPLGSASPATSTTGRVLVGTFNLTATGLGTGTVLTADPQGNTTGYLTGGTTGTQVFVDSMLAANNDAVTFNVTAAVPEPTTMVLTGLASSAFGLGAWIRRRRQATEPATVA